ncbi:MAG: hypothetical protein Q8L14_19830 [Myxococcales bacterium]|nr:hypothetical protein [Myxococcales bacterium]
MNGMFCADCAARPEVDFLDAYKREHWGKRDSWAWLLGLTGLVSAATSAFLLTTIDLAEPFLTGALPWLVFTALYAVIGVAFWFRVRHARAALVVLVVLLGIVLVAALGPMALGTMMIPLAIAASALTTTRTKLFFQMDVTAAALEKEWRRRYDNPMARQALSYGLASLFFPLFGPIAFVTGLIGLSRVNPTATPSIGGRKAALVGVLLGFVVTLAWVLVVGMIVSDVFRELRP